MLELRINVIPKENKDIIAQKIHNSLKGYEEYVNSNILLNKDEDYITLLIGPDSDKNENIKLICKTENVGNLSQINTEYV